MDGGMVLLATWSHVMGMRIIADVTAVILFCSNLTNILLDHGGEGQSSTERIIEKRGMKVMAFMEVLESLAKATRLQPGRVYGQGKFWSSRVPHFGNCFVLIQIKATQVTNYYKYG